MPVTISIVDKADGTGATATISGSVGAVNDVYAGRTVGEVGTVAFTLVASRTGDGTLNLPIVTRGLYFGYAITSGALSNLYYFPVTDGLDAVSARVRKAVADTLKLLVIPPAAHVYEQMFPEDTNIKFPCMIATVDGVQETESSVVNNRDDIGRPVKVMVCDRSDKFDHSKLPTYELWRQAAERCFRSQQLAGVPEVVKCLIEPYVIIDPNARHYQHMVTGFVVRAGCREVRGVGQ